MSYAHINANVSGTSGLLQKGTTVLTRVTVGKAGSADWAVTIYDGIDNTGDVVSVNDFTSGGQYDYVATLTKGLYVEAAGTTPGDITIVFD